MKYLVTLNGIDYEVEVERGEAIVLSETETAAPAVSAAPAPAVSAAAEAPSAPVAAAGSVAGEPILSPLPGSIVSVAVVPGAVVKKGDILLIIEAMKMENEVIAYRDGTVLNVLCKSGDTVQSETLLLTLQ